MRLVASCTNLFYIKKNRFSLVICAFLRTFALDMVFPIHINIVDLVFKGMLIGMIASAPMGPVGVLCVQRTLKKGRWYGLVTGIGASVSDIIYAGITGFGMAFVMDFINNEQNKFYLQIIGSILLLCFGIYTWRTDPTKNMHQSGQQKGSLWYNMWTAFLVTFSNPLIVFLFMALFAQFAFVIPDHPFEMVIGFASIVGGALLWWYGLSWVIDKLRTIFDAAGIRVINQVIGAVVMLFSIISLFGTVTNLFRFF
jgi:threonine/homoserine/homoserine lactone efflux protein